MLADRALAATGKVSDFLVAAIGLAPGRIGLAGRIASTTGSLAILLLGLQTGHTGGRLVYQHGAGAAYASDPGSGSTHGNSITGGWTENRKQEAEED